MNREEFIKAYSELVKNAVAIAAKARREGLLGLDSDIDREKAAMRDIFHYGLQFAVDGVACEIIDKILSNIIAQEEDGYTRILKTIQKEVAFCVQQGFNPKLLYYTLNSYTDLPIKDDVFCPGARQNKVRVILCFPSDFDEDEAQYEHDEGKYDGEL